MITLRGDIAALVERTPFVDTHEHIMEESLRTEARDKTKEGNVPAPDFGMLFAGYSDSDLAVAGMPAEDIQRLFSYEAPLEEKWRLVAPFYARARHTGYLRGVREAVRALFGEEDLREDNYGVISERLAEQIRPGFYKRILNGTANVEYCQVDSVHTSPLMRETAQPELLAQDLNTLSLCTDVNVKALSPLSGIEVTSLKNWHEVIDWAFATYGPRAIATKNQSAYSRRLDYEQVSEEDAAPLFERFLQGKERVTPAEFKAIQDHLFHYCIRKAVEYNLPVKLHTGYYAGHGGMPLERVRCNAGDLCPILRAHRDARFDLFHIGYPYQDEFIALAKHYANAFVDLCWTWIINPVASVRFLKEFLMAAPANKLLTFGGDHRMAELSVGHAAVARQGLTQAISELVEEGWVEERDVPSLVERLMRGNAHELFDYERALANWATVGAERT